MSQSIKLALDTTSSNFSFSLKKYELGKSDNAIVSHSYLASSKSSRDSFISELDTFLKNNKVKKSEISEVIVNHGPGSFSGIRVALSSVLAFKEVFSAKLTFISGLYAESLRYKTSPSVCVVLQRANSAEDYFAAMKISLESTGSIRVTSLIEPSLVDRSKLKEILLSKLKKLEESLSDKEIKHCQIYEKQENFSCSDFIPLSHFLIELSEVEGGFPCTVVHEKQRLSGQEGVSPLYINKLNALTLKERGL